MLFPTLLETRFLLWLPHGSSCMRANSHRPLLRPNRSSPPLHALPIRPSRPCSGQFTAIQQTHIEHLFLLSFILCLLREVLWILQHWCYQNYRSERDSRDHLNEACFIDKVETQLYWIIFPTVTQFTGGEIGRLQIALYPLLFSLYHAPHIVFPT